MKYKERRGKVERNAFVAGYDRIMQDIMSKRTKSKRTWIIGETTEPLALLLLSKPYLWFKWQIFLLFHILVSLFRVVCLQLSDGNEVDGKHGRNKAPLICNILTLRNTFTWFYHLQRAMASSSISLFHFFSILYRCIRLSSLHSNLICNLSLPHVELGLYGIWPFHNNNNDREKKWEKTSFILRLKRK